MADPVAELEACNANLMLAVQYGQELLEKNNLLQHEMGTLASEYQETLISYSAQQQKLSKLEQEIETLKATASITAGTTGTTTTLVQSMTISPQPSSLLDICSKCSLSMSSSSSSPLPLSFSNGVSVGTSPEENVGGIHLRSDNVATGLDDITVNLTLSKIHTIPNDSVMQKRFDASNLAAIESLEKTVHCLQLQLENTTEELTQAIETNRNTERYARKLEEDLETIRVDTEDASSRVSQLDQEKKQLYKEKMDQSRSWKTEKEVLTAKSEVLSGRIAELDQTVMDLTNESHALRQASESALQEKEDLVQKCAELEEMLEEYRTYREEYESQSNRLEEMSLDMECVRQHCETLQARLSALEGGDGNSSPSKDGPSKSLLGEVEDRRKELEDHHKNLMQQHFSLMEKHGVIIQDRQRMKTHISRLRQLSVRTGSDDSCGGGSGSSAYRELEEALNQSEAEKKQLLESLKRLQAQLNDGSSSVMLGLRGSQTSPFKGGSPQSSSTTTGPPMSPNSSSKDEIIEFLRFKIVQVQEECSKLRKEANSALMLKQNESHKLRNSQQLLRERAGAYDQANAIIAQLRYELDEVKSMMKNGNLEADFDNNNNDSAVKPVTKAARPSDKTSSSLSATTSMQLKTENTNTTSSTITTTSSSSVTSFSHSRLTSQEDKENSSRTINTISNNSSTNNDAKLQQQQQPEAVVDKQKSMTAAITVKGVPPSPRANAGGKPSTRPADDNIPVLEQSCPTASVGECQQQ